MGFTRSTDHFVLSQIAIVAFTIVRLLEGDVMDWRKKPERSLVFIMAFAGLGAVFGDDILRLAYSVFGIQAPIWK